ncbi:MAG: hypothetical protein EXR69_09585 [Myxococcales bacterium]|nr:hypothetical protein [Myxococcales bacterium]
MSIRVCPNCGIEVPQIANLCKSCFHDFKAVVAKGRSPLFPIVLLALGCAIVSAAAFGYIQDQNKTSKISIDSETQSMVFTTRYATRTEADRVYFKDIASVEYISNTRPRPFQVDVVTSRGDRFVYKQADQPLDVQARKLAELTGRPLIERDESGASKPDGLK